MVPEGDVMRAGERYERACILAAGLWPVDPDRAEARRADRTRRWHSLGEALRSAQQEEQLATEGLEREAISRRVARLLAERERVSRVLEQPEFARAVEYAQLDVTVEQVLHLAALATVLVAAVALVATAAVVSFLGLSGAFLASVIACAAVAPVVAYVAVVSYPEALSKRLRVASLGNAPEAVNYMAMSMRVVPALDRAIEFAAQHTDGPLASRLRRLLWGVYLRDPPAIEGAFLRFAREWGDDQEDLKRAFFALGSAALERTEAGLQRALEKARQIAFEGTKARIQEYAVGLHGPTTVLFALGVLLPLIIGAMLPLLSVGGIAPPSPGGGAARVGADLTLPTVFAMDILFPIGAFAYAYRILGSRPGTGPAGGSPGARSHRVVLASAGLIVIAVGSFALVATPGAMLVPLWVLVLAATVFLLPGLRPLEARRRAVAAVEAEFPDALFILGSRIAEGTPAERALVLAAEATRGSEVSALLNRIVRRLQTSRASLGEVLFAPDGVLADTPSRAIRAAFRMVVEVSRKDSATAGKTIVETSVYLRELREMDREIRRDLSSTVDAMQSTAALFAPIVLGVTCALYGLLSRAFSRLVVLGLSPTWFLAVVGVYLFLAVGVITYFRVGIAHGRDPGEVHSQLVRTWPISMGVFTAAYLVAEIALVG